MLIPGKEIEYFRHVQAGRTAELSMALSFNNVEANELYDVEIQYMGTRAEPPTWVSSEAKVFGQLHSCLQYSDQSAHILNISNELHFAHVAPSVTFRTATLTTRPTDAKIVPLGARDIFDNGTQIFALLLSYKFNGSGFEPQAFL